MLESFHIPRTAPQNKNAKNIYFVKQPEAASIYFSITE